MVGVASVRQRLVVPRSQACGLLQTSDKVEGGDFDEHDESRLECLARVSALGLDALRKVRALRSGDPAPASPMESLAGFVAVEGS